MGRAVRLEGNPKLAKPHTKGATVTLTQDLNHAQYGGVAYQWFRLMIVELALAEQSRDHLRDQHSVVLAMPVDVSNIRTIDDLDFLADVYDAGSGMVSHVVRAVQHLAVEMQREGQPLLATTVADRLQDCADWELTTAVMNRTTRASSRSSGFETPSSTLETRTSTKATRIDGTKYR